MDLALAQIKYMLGQKLGYENQDIYDYLPYEDAPPISFDEMREKYDDEDE